MPSWLFIVSIAKTLCTGDGPFSPSMGQKDAWSSRGGELLSFIAPTKSPRSCGEIIWLSLGADMTGGAMKLKYNLNTANNVK